MQFPFVRVGEMSWQWKMLFNDSHSFLLHIRGLLVPGTPGLTSIQFQADGIREFEWSDPATHMAPSLIAFLQKTLNLPHFYKPKVMNSRNIYSSSQLLSLHILLSFFFLLIPEFLNIQRNLFTPFIAQNCLYLF